MVSYKVKPFGKMCSKVLQYHNNELIGSWIIYAKYYGGNIQDFINNNKHINQQVIIF